MKHVRRAAVLALTLAALAASAGGASAATAPGYGEFDDCPDRVAAPNATLCAITTVTGGHLKLGTKNTPITDPIVLAESIAPPDIVTVGKFDGGRQVVPGGVVGITGLEWLRWLFPFNLLQLYAEAELAGTPGQPLQEPVRLPLRVKLESAVLNDHCYIGSTASPVLLNLVTGTTSPPPPNTPISGTGGSIVPDPVLPNVYRLTGAKFVDNSFAVPGANGCDLIGFGLINTLVNAQSGLPSAAGRNEAVQNVKADLADLATVYPPDGIE
jgi:hypothetical protein